MEKTTYLGNIHKNIMGTTSFDLRIPSMRKNQDFIVYPIQKDDEAKKILIQSDTRIGFLDMETGEGTMTKNHSNGAYFHTYTMEKIQNKLDSFKLRNIDLEALRLFIFSTQGSKVSGNGVCYVDNSNAKGVL